MFSSIFSSYTGEGLFTLYAIHKTHKSNNNTNHEIKHTAKNQQHLWDKDSQLMLSHAEVCMGRSATEGNVM